MSIDKAFLLFRGRRPTREQQERLEEVRSQLGIADNDALWAVLVALEYYLELYEGVGERLKTSLEASQHPPPKHAPAHWTTWVGLVSATLAAQILFAALCMFVGHRAASSEAPVWMITPSPWSGVGAAVAATLRAPAGWLAFVLMVPGAIACIRWAVALCNADDKLQGWMMGTASTALLLGCAAALYWLCG